jgi:ketosteroid isomerase-like protein
MSQENVDTVRALYRQWNRGDLSGFSELLAEDAEFVNPPEAVEPGTRRGPDGFAAAWWAVIDSFGSSSHEVLHLHDAGEAVIASVLFRGEGTESGIGVQQPEFHVWTFRGGKISRFAWFRRLAEALEATNASNQSLEERQLEMLRRMAGLDPPPVFMGGYAEDALLAGAVTRAHQDFDWLLPRNELDLRKEQARRLGFGGFETWGEAAPGEPFYLFAENGDLKLDLGIADWEGSDYWMKVHKLSFQIDGEDAPAGYRVRLPSDMFEQAPAEIEGIEVRVASPLALFQIRTAIADQGSFGEPSARQREASRLLEKRLLQDMPADRLTVVVKRL